MITTSEILKDLNSLQKKIEFAQITYPNNDIWNIIYPKIKEIYNLLKRDKRIFG